MENKELITIDISDDFLKEQVDEYIMIGPGVIPIIKDALTIAAEKIVKDLEADFAEFMLDQQTTEHKKELN